MPDVSPARRAAFRILLAVERGGVHADDLLRGEAVNALYAPDRNLATNLVLGVLRWQLWLYDRFCPLLKRPNAKLDPEVLIALRLAAYQLLFLDRIPAHAAISDSVELIKQAGHRFASGMANAVLRRLAGAARVPLSDKAALHAYPAWMVARWIAHYGPETTSAICRYGQQQPALSLRIAKAEAENELAQAGIELAPGELLTDARIAAGGDVTATAAFREGRVRVQDEGSQLIAEVASTSLVQGQKKILDACAAPGGKTLILAERHRTACILACESSQQRLVQLRERLAAHADRVECRLADASALQEEAVFDLALVDAPCSGTGTLGRNPEIRHRLRPEDLPRHAERQCAILRAVIRSVRPGGRIVYSTCSLEPEENERVAAGVAAEMRGAHPLSLVPSIDALLAQDILTDAGAERLRGCLTPEGALRLLPGSLHTDGFFIALLEKSA
jgi:16S rRNA (cytosine967-C5)-methyltransferase